MKSEARNLEKRLAGISRRPELEEAFQEGYNSAVSEFTKLLKKTPIEVQDTVIEALKSAGKGL